MEIFLDALLDALIDGVKMLPFLYLAYLLIEWCAPVWFQRGRIQLLRQPGHHPRHIAGRIYRHQRRGHSAAGR